MSTPEHTEVECDGRGNWSINTFVSGTAMTSSKVWNRVFSLHWSDSSAVARVKASLSFIALSLPTTFGFHLCSSGLYVIAAVYLCCTVRQKWRNRNYNHFLSLPHRGGNELRVTSRLEETLMNSPSLSPMWSRVMWSGTSWSRRAFGRSALPHRIQAPFFSVTLASSGRNLSKQHIRSILPADSLPGVGGKS